MEELLRFIKSEKVFGLNEFIVKGGWLGLGLNEELFFFEI
jgi:hypothetical protein